MTQSKPNFYLVAHSHGVSLLDAIANWREKFRVSGTPDANFGSAFQGWFNGSIIRDTFRTEVVEPTLPMEAIEAWVISFRDGLGALARLDTSGAGGTLQVVERFSRILASWNGPIPIVSMLNGNEPARTMLANSPAYDFLDAEIAGVEKGVPIIDELFIEQTISTWVDAVYYSLVAVKRLVNNPLVHVLPPPPRLNPHLSPYLEGMLDRATADDFLPDRLRVKWYRRYCRRLISYLAAIDCQVLAPPPEACTASGLLKEEYAEGISHANSRYGLLVARQLASTLGLAR